MSFLFKESNLAIAGFLVVWLVLLGVLVLPIGSSACASEKNLAWGDDPTRSNDGPIRFMLTPKGMENGYFIVEIQVDTHAGDLKNLDLSKQVLLKAENRSIAPTKAVRLGGHHAKGTLAFSLQEAPGNFEIVILAVGTMGDVAFRWP